MLTCSALVSLIWRRTPRGAAPHHHKRGSGRCAQRGLITADHRRTVGDALSIIGAHLVRCLLPGVYRRWSRVETPRGGHHDLVVSSDGASAWSAPVANAPEYLTAALLPAPPTLGGSQPLRWTAVGVHVVGPDYYAAAPGTSVHVLRHRDDHVECRLPSRQLKWLDADQVATLGVRPNGGVRQVRHTRAGDSFVQGWRPHTRGVAMNPVDHPHGGGQGKTAGGGPAVTPWGQLTKGYRTVRA